jgi:hypothetical protein
MASQLGDDIHEEVDNFGVVISRALMKLLSVCREAGLPKTQTLPKMRVKAERERLSPRFSRKSEGRESGVHFSDIKEGTGREFHCIGSGEGI